MMRTILKIVISFLVLNIFNACNKDDNSHDHINHVILTAQSETKFGENLLVLNSDTISHLSSYCIEGNGDVFWKVILTNLSTQANICWQLDSIENFLVSNYDSVNKSQKIESLGYGNSILKITFPYSNIKFKFEFFIYNYTALDESKVFYIN